MSDRSPGEVLDFWFGNCRSDAEVAERMRSRWFGGGPDLDDEIRRRFGSWLDAAASGELDDWEKTTPGRLALILLLDQMPRNLHRGTAQAFAHDERARQLARSVVERGLFELTPPEQVFAVMPLMHSEDLGDQERALEIYDRCIESAPDVWRPLLADCREYCRDHHNVIARFGRFPHRNSVLGRANTREEEVFLEREADSWGQ